MSARGRWKVRMRPLLALAVLLALPLPARADVLDQYLEEWEIVSRRMDERGLEEQREVLFKIADLDTKGSRRALERLRDRYGRGDWRRTRLILSALARPADPDDVDEIVRWVEVRKQPFLIENLGEILAQVGKPPAREHLRGKALRRATPPVKAQIARALGLQGSADAIPALLLLLKEKFVRVRVEALDALALVGDERIVGPVLVFLKDKDERVRDAAARTLGHVKDPRVLEALVEAFEDECPRVVESAALSLGRLADPAAIPALIEHLKATLSEDLRVSYACATALEEISGKAIGLDPERWADWWEAVKDRPFRKVDPEREAPEGRTVPANRYYGFPIYSSRLVFVLDVSRSMGWNGRLDQAKEELIRVIEHLPPTTVFNIVTFSDGASAWSKELEEAKSGTLRKAVKYVNRLGPQNGTNAWAALQLAMKDERVDTIFFLSDGSPSVGEVVEPDLILAELRALNRYRRVRIHCVALLTGEAPTGFAGMQDLEKAEAFMRRLAAEHDGELKVVK